MKKSRCISIIRLILYFFVPLVLTVLSTLSPANLSAQEQTESAQQSKGTQAVLYVRSSVAGTNVYVNGVYKGFAPLTLENMVPGIYSVRLEKKGWYTKTYECSLNAASTYTIYAQMQRITGSVFISADQENVLLYFDGELLTAQKNKAYTLKQNGKTEFVILEAPEGYHSVEAKKFGWESASTSVYVFPETAVQTELHLPKAQFDITSFSCAAASFNPHNPGALGVCRMHFSVSAPGSGVLKIQNDNGTTVYRQPLGNFTDWEQSCTWNGTDNNGVLLQDGTYRAHIEGTPDEHWEKANESGTPDKPAVSNAYNVPDEPDASDTPYVSHTLNIEIDRSIFYPLAPISAGGVSSGLVASPRIMPENTLVSFASGAASFSVPDGFKAAPFFIGIATTPKTWLETSCRFGVEVQEKKTLPFTVNLSVKAAGRRHNQYYGGILRYGYVSERHSSVFNEAGLAAGGIAGIRLGSFFINLSQEIVFGSEQGILSPFEGCLKTGAAASFQKSFVSVHLWTAYFSPFNAQSIRALGSIHCGTDIVFLLPRSIVAPIISSAYAYGENRTHDISVRIGAALFQ